MSFDVLDKLSSISEGDFSECDFSDAFPHTFSIVSNDGREIELKPDGANTPVT